MSGSPTTGREDGDEPEWVLKDVSFTIKAGETAAIVGHTGAGKTTIISLLARFYDVQRGEILIDGVEHPAASARPTCAGTSPSCCRTSSSSPATSPANIGLGDERISEERVRAARASWWAPTRFIEQLPGQYHAEVKERGATLSVGQKQLISFARALAYHPRILVLDEATSSVDTETELLIQEAIKKLLHGRTSIVIAHRLSTIQSAIKIIVMHKGEIREMGTHQELLARGGIYFEALPAPVQGPGTAGTRRAALTLCPTSRAGRRTLQLPDRFRSMPVLPTDCQANAETPR